jgi:hypothetical protein
MIHIMQVLCPKRHCFMAVAWDDTTSDQAEIAYKLDEVFDEWVKAGNPRVCALCGATDFMLDDGVTRFKTLEEAQPYLIEQEWLQWLSREAILRGPERN